MDRQRHEFSDAQRTAAKQLLRRFIAKAPSQGAPRAAGRYGSYPLGERYYRRWQHAVCSTLCNEAALPRALSSVFDCMLGFLPPQYVRDLLRAAATTPGVVYAIVRKPSRSYGQADVYVGLTHLTCFGRFLSHVRQAADALQSGEPLSPLHRCLAACGPDGFWVLPLQRVPGSVHNTKAFLRTGRQLEDTWMQRLSSFVTAQGLNERREGTGMHYSLRFVWSADYARHSRIYASRDMMRRLRFLAGMLRTGIVSVRRLRPLECYHRRTLISMQQFLVNTPAQVFGVTESEYAQLDIILHLAIKPRVSNVHMRPDLMWRVPAGVRQFVCKQRLRDLLCAPDVVTARPWGMTDAMRLRFDSGVTLFKLFVNYGRVAALSSGELHALADAPCSCHFAARSALCPSGIPHVMATDPGDLLDPRLKFYWDAGSRYRVHEPQVRGQLEAECVGSLAECQRLAERAAVPSDGSPRVPWCDVVMGRLVALFDSRPDLFGATTLTMGGGVAVPLFTDTLRHAVTRLQRDFVITVMDKNGANFVLVCKKYYVQRLLADLCIPHPPSAPVPPGEYYSRVHPVQVVDAYRAAAVRLQPIGIPVDISLPPAYYAATVKMHKQPPSLRYLACSQQTPLSDACDVALWLLRAAQDAFVEMWDACVRKWNLPALCSCWIIKNTHGLAPFIHSFNQNAAAVGEVPCKEAAMPQIFDFERLYTNIPLNDLHACLSQLLEWLFEFKGASAVHFTSRKEEAAQWLPPPPLGAAPTYTCGVVYPDRRRPRDPVHCTLSLRQAVTVLHVVVTNTFLHFGEYMLHQDRGIPMGIQPAPFIANLFLGFHEFNFVMRVLCAARMPETTPARMAVVQQRMAACAGCARLAPFDPKSSVIPNIETTSFASAPHLWNENALTLLNHFRFTVRYIDDLAALANLMLKYLLYHQSPPYSVGKPGGPRQDICGIYPQCLRVTSSAPAGCDCVPFMDALLCVERVGAGFQVVVRLYDKRFSPIFRDAQVHIVRFVHASTNVDSASTRNTLGGQLSRLAGIITDWEDFSLQMAVVIYTLVSKNYPLTHVLRDYHRRLVRRADLFPSLPRRVPVLYETTMDHLRRFTRSGLPGVSDD